MILAIVRRIGATAAPTLAAVVVAACSTDPGAASPAGADAGATLDGCASLFGRPNAKTGVGADLCRP